MNNPFGLPDEVFLSILESVSKEATSFTNNARKTTVPPVQKSQEELIMKGAESAKKIYDSYIKVGFTEFQAFDLLKCVLTNKR